KNQMQKSVVRECGRRAHDLLCREPGGLPSRRDALEREIHGYPLRGLDDGNLDISRDSVGLAGTAEELNECFVERDLLSRKGSQCMHRRSDALVQPNDLAE